MAEAFGQIGVSAEGGSRNIASPKEAQHIGNGLTAQARPFERVLKRRVGHIGYSVVRLVQIRCVLALQQY